MPCSSSNQAMQRTTPRFAARLKEELRVKELQRCALSGAVADLVLVRCMKYYLGFFAVGLIGAAFAVTDAL